MSSTLTNIMDETTMNLSSPPQTVPEIPKPTSILPYLLIGLILLIGMAIYFLPNILNALSLPEQIIEEEVKKEVDTTKKKKFDQDFLEDKLEQEIVDKAGVLEEQGFCYIGTDRGIRSCIDVVPGEKCMSGQIFPSMDICVNPNLRM